MRLLLIEDDEMLGAAVRTGKGHGPLNHGYAPVAQVVVPQF